MEGERGSKRQRFPVVDETVVVVNPLENSRVNQLDGAEPTAADVDPRDVASRHALVRDLHSVTGYSVGHRFGRCLVHHNVRLLALLSDPIRLCSRLCLLKRKHTDEFKLIFHKF